MSKVVDVFSYSFMDTELEIAMEKQDAWQFCEIRKAITVTINYVQ